MADSPDDLPLSRPPTSRTGQVSRAEELFHEHAAEIERFVLDPYDAALLPELATPGIEFEDAESNNIAVGAHWLSRRAPV